MRDIIGRMKDRFKDKAVKFQERTGGKQLYIDLKCEDIPLAVKFLFTEMGCRFITATAIDTPPAIEILYHFSNDSGGEMINLRAIITDKKKPRIESITPIIKGAEWIEREMWEMLGINFTGHPNLTHLLLIDEWPEGDYPLRHDKAHGHGHEHKEAV